MIRVLAILFLTLAPVATLAGDGGYKEALALYNAGQFEEAAKTATGLDTADGDALAARAYLVEAAYIAPEGEDEAYLARGKMMADRALARDPAHVEAMLHMVIALGYEARLGKPVDAHEAGYARRAKKLLKQAEALDPENPWVWATWGGWHAEIIRSAGSFLGGLFYGASKREAREAFDRAIDLAPDNPAIRIEYAKALVSMGGKFLPEARDQLQIAADLRARNQFETLLKDQGARLLRALDGGKHKTRETLDGMTPFAR